MLVGHARKSKQHRDLQALSLGDVNGTNKENMTLEEASSNASSSVSDLGSQSDMKTRLSAKRRREEGFDKLVTLLKTTIENQERIQNINSTANQDLIAEHRCANEEARLGREEVKLMRDEMRLSREANERTNLAIIEILKQGLL